MSIPCDTLLLLSSKSNPESGTPGVVACADGDCLVARVDACDALGEGDEVEVWYPDPKTGRDVGLSGSIVQVDRGAREVVMRLAGEALPADLGADPEDDRVWVGIPTDLLRERPLVGSLYDHTGETLAVRGDVLSGDDIERMIEKGLVVGEDWFPIKGIKSRRVSIRTRCDLAVKLWVVERDCVRTIGAVMTDVSRGGAGVRVPTVVYRGALVMIEFTCIKHGGWIAGRVEHSTMPPNSTRCQLGIRYLQSKIQYTPLPDPNNPTLVLNMLVEMIDKRMLAAPDSDSTDSSGVRTVA